MYYFNEYISMMIISSGIEYIIANYLTIREEYYSQQPSTGG
jgi:hypothetical protein